VNGMSMIMMQRKDPVDQNDDFNLDYTITDREFVHNDHEFITVSLNFS
jgi:hypothetical protein